MSPGFEPARIGRDAVLATLRLTDSLIERHGSRIAGTRQCLNAADQIAEMLRIHCDKVVQDRFVIHPGSFWNIGRIMASSYMVSVAFLFMGGIFTYVSLAAGLFGIFYGVVLYVFNGRMFDRFFPHAEGCNVWGVIEPSGEVRRQVILSGHHDSPYVISFLLNWKHLAHARLIAAVVVYAATVGLSLSAVLLTGKSGSIPATAVGAALFLGVIFVLPLYFVITPFQSPGAGDNLNATAMAITAAVHFDLKRKKKEALEHTRLIVLSTDGEEVGQRGAMDFAENHRKELRNVPTSVLNMDSIYKLKELSIVGRDRNGTQGLSRGMAEQLHKVAENLGYRVPVMSLPPGGGGTDAAVFAKAGIETTSLIGISVGRIGKNTVYHTLQDTVDHIEPEAVEAVLDMVLNYILVKDTE